MLHLLLPDYRRSGVSQMPERPAHAQAVQAMANATGAGGTAEAVPLRPRLQEKAQQQGCTCMTHVDILSINQIDTQVFRRNRILLLSFCACGHLNYLLTIVILIIYLLLLFAVYTPRLIFLGKVWTCRPTLPIPPSDHHHHHWVMALLLLP